MRQPVALQGHSCSYKKVNLNYVYYTVLTQQVQQVTMVTQITFFGCGFGGFKKFVPTWTRALPIHGVKFIQRVCGRTPALLPDHKSAAKSSTSSKSTTNRTARFQRNSRSNSKLTSLRDHRGNIQVAFLALAWLRLARSRVKAVTRAWAGEIARNALSAIILRRFEGLRTKKFT